MIAKAVPGSAAAFSFFDEADLAETISPRKYKSLTVR
jgi:hypothetical protein